MTRTSILLWYASPSFVVPLISYLSATESAIELKTSKSLLDILFPNGLETEGTRTLLLKSKLNEYINKDYLPIIVIPSDAVGEDETSSVLSIVENVLYGQLGSAKNIINGIRYVVGEIIDNITQHSKSPRALMYSKINKNEKYIEIGIADLLHDFRKCYAANTTTRRFSTTKELTDYLRTLCL